MSMSEKTVGSRPQVKRSGRPKGVVSARTQTMIETWDAMKARYPTLSNTALLDAVAETVFGQRINLQVRRRERTQLRRTLQRHGRL